MLIKKKNMYYISMYRGHPRSCVENLKALIPLAHKGRDMHREPKGFNCVLFVIDSIFSCLAEQLMSVTDTKVTQREEARK